MKLIRSLYLTNRLFIAAGIAVLCFIASFSWPVLLPLSKLVLLTILVAVLADILMLYLPGNAFTAQRMLPEKFSNGDQNNVTIYTENNYRFKVSIKIIDEVPEQFQLRDFLLKESVQSNET